MADEFTIRWNRVSWDRVERDDEIPKDRRLLLIGMRRDGPMDALEVGISDVVGGHWNRHRAAFVPVSVPGPPGPSPTLRVTYWADLPLPSDIKLREIEELKA